MNRFPQFQAIIWLLFLLFHTDVLAQTPNYTSRPYTREIYTQLSNSTRYQYQVLIHSFHDTTPKNMDISTQPEITDQSRFYVWESDSIEIRLVKHRGKEDFDLTIKRKGAYLWECAMCAPELISRFDFSNNFCGFSIAQVLPPEKGTRKVATSFQKIEVSKGNRIIKGKDELTGGRWALFFNAYPDPQQRH